MVAIGALFGVVFCNSFGAFAPCSSTPSSCHQVCSAWRAAPQAPPGDQQGDLFLGQTHWVVEVLGVSWAWFDAWVRGPAVGGPWVHRG